MCVCVCVCVCDPNSDHLRQETVKMAQQLKQQKHTLKSSMPHHLPPLDETATKQPQKTIRKKSSQSSTVTICKSQEVHVRNYCTYNVACTIYILYNVHVIILVVVVI